MVDGQIASEAVTKRVYERPKPPPRPPPALDPRRAGPPVQTLIGHGSNVFSTQWTPDARHVFSTGNDAQAARWAPFCPLCVTDCYQRNLEDAFQIFLAVSPNSARKVNSPSI